MEKVPQDSRLAEWLTERLEELDAQVDAAAIFGSIAAGTATADSDVDVLLISDISRLEAQTFFKPVGRRAGRPINVLTYTAEAWKRGVEAENPLILEIMRGPLIKLRGDIASQLLISNAPKLP